MMIAGVADTHAAIWFLAGDARLSATAKNFFDDAAVARKKIVLSSALRRSFIWWKKSGCRSQPLMI
jgi:PIN domain nuclease of toxin-antitoxin system